MRLEGKRTLVVVALMLGVLGLGFAALALVVLGDSHGGSVWGTGR